MQYHKVSVERPCDDAKDYSEQECSKTPDFGDYPKPANPSYAFCSTKGPWISNPTSSTAQSRQRQRMLDPAGRVSNVVAHDLREFIVVCHGWEGSPFSDEFAKFVSAKGYRARAPAVGQTTVEIDESAIVNSKRVSGKNPLSFAGLSGNWYIKDRSLCRREVGFTEGLVTFRKTYIEEAETRCTLRKEELDGPVLRLMLSCATEGNEYRQMRFYHPIDSNRVREIVREGVMNKSDTTLSRCT